MNNISEFIETERKKRQQESPQTANVKMSLMDLKKSLDGNAPLSGNPILEKIKQVDVITENKSNNFIETSLTNQKPQIQNQRVQSTDLNEKEDQFTRDLLAKTRSFLTGGEYVESQRKQITEEFIQPDITKNNTPQYKQQSNSLIHKKDIMDTLKDTIMDLYVKERVESIIKEYLTSDEGKKVIKSIVIGLFKKK